MSQTQNQSFLHIMLRYRTFIHHPQSSAYGSTPSYNSAPYAFLGTLPLYSSAIANMPACPCLLYPAPLNHQLQPPNPPLPYIRCLGFSPYTCLPRQ